MRKDSYPLFEPRPFNQKYDFGVYLKMGSSVIMVEKWICGKPVLILCVCKYIYICIIQFLLGMPSFKKCMALKRCLENQLVDIEGFIRQKDAGRGPQIR